MGIHAHGRHTYGGYPSTNSDIPQTYNEINEMMTSHRNMGDKACVGYQYLLS